jgi:dTDP-4-amino-4,6-dideoxygalactose transaminase
MKYKVPFVVYSQQYENLKKQIDKALKRVLAGGDLILRKDVEDFEKNLAGFVGTKYAVGLNSGTDAIFLSLKAAGIGPGDEVITVSHTFVASIAAIVQTGAKPILVDVADDFLMDMDKVKKAITKRTRAIVPVHLNGRMCQMDRLMKMAKKHKLIVIEDTAQALGARYKNRTAGSWGLTGAFSFYPAKILGCFGDAGAVTTNNAKIAENLRLLRDHGQRTKTKIVLFGWNSRLDNLQAALLNVKFRHLANWIKKRRRLAEIYNRGLTGVYGIKLPPSPGSDKRYFDVYQNFVLRASKRDELANFLKEKGVEILIKDRVANHLQEGLGLSHLKLPYTEKLAKEVISLPMYPELTREQIQYVINCVRKFYQ